MTEELRSLDKRHLWHPFTPMSLWLEGEPLVITAAEGFYLIDSDGKRYLDGVSSLWCNVHGHRVPEIDRAIREQLDKVAHSTLLGLANEPSILLAERLMRIVPPNLTRVFYSDAGATATEIAFKLAVQYWFNTGRPQKNEFVAFTEAYHGDTVGAMSIGRMPAFHKPYLSLLFKVHFAPTPFAYRSQHGDTETRRGERVKEDCLGALRRILEANAQRVAAICIEPVVQGAGGMIVQPEGFLREVRRLADEFETLLICDEVATGFARTGRMFAVEHEGVRPDLMTLAKGLTGGYLPLAATLATEKIFDAFLGEPGEGKTFFHGHTYTGNPLACAAAIANLDLMHTNDTVGNVARNAPKLAAMLEPLKNLRHVGDVRQKGYMVGIELVEEKAARRPFDPALRMAYGVCQRVRGRGVILRPLGDVIVLMPPPAMGADQLAAIVEAVRAEVESMDNRYC
jgi:adenosylmethionine-8-amino-7-oxononanoate transaminase